MNIPNATAAPGLIHEPAAVYHARPELSQSGLKELARSPRHYRHWLEHGKATTSAMRSGSYAHAFLLEYETFWDFHTLWEEATRKAAGYKAFAAEAAAAGKEIVTQSELEMLEGMRAAWLAHPLTSKLLDGALVEATALWDADGVSCKARPDIVRSDQRRIYDLKTTDDASYETFQRQAHDLGYHRQAAWYLDGLAAATGARFDTFAFIVIEKKPPHEIGIFYADPGFLAYGGALNDEGLAIYRRCLESGTWPGFGPHLQRLTLPAWVQP